MDREDFKGDGWSGETIKYLVYPMIKISTNLTYHRRVYIDMTIWVFAFELLFSNEKSLKVI